MYRSFLKPLGDFIVGGTLFILTLPILFMVSLVLYFGNKGKVFFSQVRPGKNEKLFTILKFRTMNDKKDAHGKLLPDEQRLTPLGKFIRKTSLDELPQLFNVLKGEMSLIGPRPLLTEYLPLYNEFQKQRHQVKPGITGWAQVNGRNTISWDKKFEYDVFYVQNCSFVLDLKILLKTITKVFRTEGIDAEGRVSMERFQGNK